MTDDVAAAGAPPAERRTQARHLRSLTGLRFYAALLVVISHAAHELFPAAPGRDAFYMGSVGVTFFFILSGFVLTWSSWSNRLGPSAFYRNRFARVYPMHALTWVLAGVVIIVGAGTFSPGAAVANLLLVQSWIPDSDIYFGMNGPSWSLSCEAFFYALFPLLAMVIPRLSLRRLGQLAVGLYAAAGLLAVLVHAALPGEFGTAFLYVNPLYRLWEFVLGICLASAIRQAWVPKVSARAVLVASAVMFAGVSLLNMIIAWDIGPAARLPFSGLPSDLGSLAMAPLFALVIATAAAAELRGHTLHSGSAVLVTLGKWSFALYLTNLFVMDAVGWVAGDGLSWIVGVAASLLAIGLCVAVSGVCYQFVEMPLERRLRSPAAPSRVD